VYSCLQPGIATQWTGGSLDWSATAIGGEQPGAVIPGTWYATADGTVTLSVYIPANLWNYALSNGVTSEGGRALVYPARLMVGCKMTIGGSATQPPTCHDVVANVTVPKTGPVACSHVDPSSGPPGTTFVITFTCVPLIESGRVAAYRWISGTDADCACPPDLPILSLTSDLPATRNVQTQWGWWSPTAPTAGYPTTLAGTIAFRVTTPTALSSYVGSRVYDFNLDGESAAHITITGAGTWSPTSCPPNGTASPSGGPQGTTYVFTFSCLQLKYGSGTLSNGVFCAYVSSNASDNTSGQSPTVLPAIVTVAAIGGEVPTTPSGTAWYPTAAGTITLRVTTAAISTRPPGTYYFVLRGCRSFAYTGTSVSVAVTVTKP
jgi:hypothetical protein